MKMRPSAWLELLEDSSLLARENVRFGAAAVAQLEERIPGGLPNHRPSRRRWRLPRRSSTVIERLAFLAEIEMLRGAGVQPLAELAISSHQVEFEPGALLVEPGAAPEQIFVIVEGEIQAKRGDSEAIWRYSARDIVCGAASFEGTTVRE